MRACPATSSLLGHPDRRARTRSATTTIADVEHDRQRRSRPARLMGAKTRMLAGMTSAVEMYSQGAAQSRSRYRSMTLFDQTSALPSTRDRYRRRSDRRRAPARLRPPGRRRRRSLRGRGRDARARASARTVPTGVSIALPDGLRRLRRAAQRARGAARHHHRQRAGHGRRGLPRRDPGDPTEHRQFDAVRYRRRRPDRPADRHAGHAGPFHPRRQPPGEPPRHSGLRLDRIQHGAEHHRAAEDSVKSGEPA